MLALAHEQQYEHAFIVLDCDARVVSWLPGAVHTLGYSPQEMLGETLERLFTPEDLERGDLDWELRAARSYGKAEDDRWLIRKDGIRIWVNGIVTALRDPNGHVAGYVKILRDRTDVRTRIDSLQSRLQQASRLEHEKHVAIGTLAHELRNPMGPLTNAAEVIRAVAGEDPRVATSVQIIERQVRFIAQLVGDLLEQTRAAVGKLKLHYEELNVHDVIANAIETCSGDLADRRQNVEVLMPEIVRIEADAVRLQQVLVNLITNSSKFSPAETTIWMKLAVEGDELVLRVEDRGKGIPPELLPHIFELFTQAGSEGNGMREGLGLGLGLVKSIAEAHGGTVQAKSEGDGKGAEIIVRLPLQRRSAGDTLL
jgi:two-component system CheB/CheR fusion protein